MFAAFRFRVPKDQDEAAVMMSTFTSSLQFKLGSAALAVSYVVFIVSKRSGFGQAKLNHTPARTSLCPYFQLCFNKNLGTCNERINF